MIAPTYLSTAEAATAAQVTTGRIRQLLLAERIKGRKIGASAWLIPKREIDRYIATRKKCRNRC